MQSTQDQSQTYSTADSSEPITEENIESCSATQNSEIDLDEYAMISEPSQKSKTTQDSSQEKAQESISNSVKGTFKICYKVWVFSFDGFWSPARKESLSNRSKLESKWKFWSYAWSFSRKIDY